MKFFVLFILSLSIAFAKSSSYLDYLRLKEKVLLDNLKLQGKLREIPQDVLWDARYGGLVVPRSNPWVRTYDPENPMADRDGMVYLPNIDPLKEMAKIKRVRDLIRKKQASLL